MDKLDALLSHASPSSHVFFAGRLCHTSPVQAEPGMGHLHVLQAGHLRIQWAHGQQQDITEPSLILFPRPLSCELSPQTRNGQGAQMVCAHMDFGHAMSATLTHAIPDMLVIPLAQAPALAPMLALLFQEAQAQQCGRQAALNHLMNYFLVLLLRELMAQASAPSGILAALADPRLSVAVTCMHEQPQRDWTLDSLAQAAGMSRARFAHHFRETTGLTTLAYLTVWRMEVAKIQLLKGRSLKAVAPMVGYGSAEALIRTFAKLTGLTPKDWLQAQEAPPTPPNMAALPLGSGL
jgi:AraC-like DNA-binding protein